MLEYRDYSLCKLLYVSCYIIYKLYKIMQLYLKQLRGMFYLGCFIIYIVFKIDFFVIFYMYVLFMIYRLI